MTYQQQVAALDLLCVQLTDSAFAKYYQCLENPLYLMGSKVNGIWESLYVADDSDEYVNLVRPEHLPRNLTKTQMVRLIREWLNSEPLYIFAT